MKRVMPPIEVFWSFFVLGITSFGGPVAHLGYFRRNFVQNRRWLTDEEYAALLALCQFLPGPASSQIGFCIGLHRAGWMRRDRCLDRIYPALRRADAPVAALDRPPFQGAAVRRRRCTDCSSPPSPWSRRRYGLWRAAYARIRRAASWHCLRCGVLWLLPNTEGQISVLLLGAVLGRLILTPPPLPNGTAPQRGPLSHGPALFCLGLALLLLLFAFIAPHSGALALFAAFYRAGALVFGGGHVVLPLLRDAVVVPGWVSPQLFLAGYGAAQALPGPLFTVASYLGAVNSAGPNGLPGAIIATLAIFLPGLLLVAATLPYWQNLQHRPAISSMMMGMNAAVVGLLAAAFINLLSVSTVRNISDVPVILAALALLTLGRARPLLVVLLCTAAGTLLQNA